MRASGERDNKCDCDALSPRQSGSAEQLLGNESDDDYDDTTAGWPRRINISDAIPFLYRWRLRRIGKRCNCRCFFAAHSCSWSNYAQAIRPWRKLRLGENCAVALKGRRWSEMKKTHDGVADCTERFCIVQAVRVTLQVCLTIHLFRTGRTCLCVKAVDISPLSRKQVPFPITLQHYLLLARKHPSRRFAF